MRLPTSRICTALLCLALCTLGTANAATTAPVDAAWIKANTIYAFDKKTDTHLLMINTASKMKELNEKDSPLLYRIAGEAVKARLAKKWQKGKMVSVRMTNLTTTNEYGQPDWTKSQELLNAKYSVDSLKPLEAKKIADLSDGELKSFFVQSPVR